MMSMMLVMSVMSVIGSHDPFQLPPLSQLPSS